MIYPYHPNHYEVKLKFTDNNFLLDELLKNHSLSKWVHPLSFTNLKCQGWTLNLDGANSQWISGELSGSAYHEHRSDMRLEIIVILDQELIIK